MTSTARDDVGGASAIDVLTSISHVGRRAVDEATAIIARLLDETADRSDTSDRSDTPATSDTSDGEPTSTEGPPPDAAAGEVRTALARTIDVYVDLFQRTFDSFVESLEATVRRAPSGARADRGEELVLEAAAGTSSSVRATMYLHNVGPRSAVRLAVRVTDLTAHDGTTVGAPRIDVRPAVLDTVNGGSSTTLDVIVDIAGVPPGTYYGHAFAGRCVLPIRLHIAEP